MNLQIISLGISAFLILFYIIYFFVKLVKHKSVKKAIEETKQVKEEVEDVMNSDSFLRLRETCRELIYSAEKLYSTYVGKSGVFKLDSVLKDIKIACMQEGVEYDKEYWTNYIQNEVQNMKGVK